jgi:hypothetical protein
MKLVCASTAASVPSIRIAPKSVPDGGSSCVVDAVSLPAEGVATPVLHVAFAVMLTIILAACGTTGSGSAPPASGSPVPSPIFNLAGYSAQYKRGHADGCSQRRDERLYRNEGDYMMGWNDGRSACAKSRR